MAREEVAWDLSYQTLTTWQKQTIAKIAINYSEQLSKAEALSGREDEDGKPGSSGYI